MNHVYSTRDCAIYNGSIYFYAAEIGCIVQMNKETNKLQYVPFKGFQRRFQADGCICIKDFLYFLSVDGISLLEYEIENAKYHIYNIDCGGKIDGNFLAFFSMGNNLYIFPRYAKRMVIFHCGSKEISIWKYPNKWSDIDFLSVCLQNEKAWMFSGDGKAVCLDMTTYCWELFDMHIKAFNIVHSVVNQGAVYLLSRDGRVCVWDTVKNKTHFCETEKNRQNNKSYIRMVLVGTNQCVLLPAMGNYIERYNLRTGHLISAENIADGRERIKGKEHWAAFRGYSEDVEWYYFVSHAYEEFLKISKSTGMLCWCTPQCPSEADWIKYRIDSGNTIFCEVTDSLNAFIGSLQD